MSIITDEQNWNTFPSIPENEIKPGVPDDIKKIIPILRSVYIINTISVYDYYLNECYVNSREHRTGKDEKVTSALEITGYAVSKSLAISIACVFDKNKTNIREISELCIRMSETIIEKNNNKNVFEKIKEMQDQFNEKKLEDVISNLRNFRNQALAHIDQYPQKPFTLPTYGDLEDLLLYSLNMSVLCIRFVTKRIINVEGMLSDARNKRDSLSSILWNN